MVSNKKKIINTSFIMTRYKKNTLKQQYLLSLAQKINLKY